jgi:hypothetical protein
MSADWGVSPIGPRASAGERRVSGLGGTAGGITAEDVEGGGGRENGLYAHVRDAGLAVANG